MHTGFAAGAESFQAMSDDSDPPFPLEVLNIFSASGFDISAVDEFGDGDFEAFRGRFAPTLEILVFQCQPLGFCQITSFINYKDDTFLLNGDFSYTFEFKSSPLRPPVWWLSD